MIYFFKPLPKSEIDFSEWTPIIKNEWVKHKFMYFVYALQIILIVCSINVGVWNVSTWMAEIIMFIIIFVIHELLHIITVFKQGDLSFTHSGVFFWLNSSAVMSKLRFWLFMTLPFIVLTIIPAIIALFITDFVRDVLVFVSLTNAIIASSDMINSIIILIKPRDSVFCRGYYKQ